MYRAGGRAYADAMNVKVVVHEAAEGGFWAEVPSLPGCASQAETMEELIANIREAITGWLEADGATREMSEGDRILELAL